MSKIAAARRAFRDGGVPEVVRRTRRWLAGGPGTEIPAQRAAAPKPRPRADDVDHARAYAWFERRRATYESLANAVAPYVDRQGVVFDVGGNIGYFTKVLGETVDFRGTVHLFEPVPNLARLCATTLADVPYDVHIHEFGLGADDATMDIFISDDGNLGWNTLVAERATAGMTPTSISIRSFESLGIDEAPALVKIDVEGAESQVIRGMLPALQRWQHKPVILCEIGWGTKHPHWQEELATFRELESLGYRPVGLDQSPVALESLDKTTDVLFLPA